MPKEIKFKQNAKTYRGKSIIRECYIEGFEITRYTYLKTLQETLNKIGEELPEDEIQELHELQLKKEGKI